MKYRKKPVVIEAITFDELVAHGRKQTPGINGMPWSFDYADHPITHENDECYLIPTLEGTMFFTPDDMLITGVKGEIYPCKGDIFEMTYELVEMSGTIETMDSLGDNPTAKSMSDTPDWPEPERCPFHSRAWGCRCDYPAGHTKESVGYDDCNSKGDGFASGYNPWTEPDGSRRFRAS